MASRPDPRTSRRLLAAALATAFALSAIRDLRLLAAAGVLAALAFHRGFWRNLARTARAVVPISAFLSLASLLVARVTGGGWPSLSPFAALTARAALIGFVTFSALDRVDLLGALAPYPVLCRLAVVTLAQIHSLRLLVVESRDGLRSRLPRRPGALDVARNAGGISGALFTLSSRNAREIADAMKSRGY